MIFHLKTLDDTSLNMEIALTNDSEGPEYAKVTKSLCDTNGISIGTFHDDTILDTWLYEVEYLDGNKAALTSNTIAENLFSQVHEEGNRHVLFDATIDHHVDWSELQRNDAFTTSANGGHHHKKNTQGWEILEQSKYDSTTWEVLKDAKVAYPVQITEYVLWCNIIYKPIFEWWC